MSTVIRKYCAQCIQSTDFGDQAQALLETDVSEEARFDDDPSE